MSFPPSIRANQYLTTLREVELTVQDRARLGLHNIPGQSLPHLTSPHHHRHRYCKCDEQAYYGKLHQTKITIRHHLNINKKMEKIEVTRNDCSQKVKWFEIIIGQD